MTKKSLITLFTAVGILLSAMESYAETNWGRVQIK